MENEVITQSTNLISDTRIDKIEQMLQFIIDNQPKQSNYSFDTRESINFDMRLVEGFSQLYGMYSDLFSQSKVAEEYIPAWIVMDSNKWLQKQFKKQVKQLKKDYKKQLRIEKHGKVDDS